MCVFIGAFPDVYGVVFGVTIVLMYTACLVLSVVSEGHRFWVAQFFRVELLGMVWKVVGQEVKTRQDEASHEKFHGGILQGVRNISRPLKTTALNYSFKTTA